MKTFGKDKLADVEVYLGEPNDQVREGMRSIMRDYGMRRTRTFARLEDMLTAIREAPPDLLIAGDSIGPALFDAVRDIRHFKIGQNPFMVISLMVGEAEGMVKRAIMSGADDVMIKPVAPAKLLERVGRLSSNRQPFIVTNDYLGPERRKADDTRPSNIRQLNVVNTFQAKVDGKALSAAELGKAVELNMNDVMAARLDSHGLKLGWVCGLILKAYQERKIDKDLEERILILVGVLEDAANTAGSIDQPDLAQICKQMARQVEEMAEIYENPTSGQLGIIQKLTRAFELAKTAKMSPPTAVAS